MALRTLIGSHLPVLHDYRLPAGGRLRKGIFLLHHHISPNEQTSFKRSPLPLPSPPLTAPSLYFAPEFILATVPGPSGIIIFSPTVRGIRSSLAHSCSNLASDPPLLLNSRIVENSQNSITISQSLSPLTSTFLVSPRTSLDPSVSYVLLSLHLSLHPLPVFLPLRHRQTLLISALGF